MCTRNCMYVQRVVYYIMQDKVALFASSLLLLSFSSFCFNSFITKPRKDTIPSLSITSCKLFVCALSIMKFFLFDDYASLSQHKNLKLKGDTCNLYKIIRRNCQYSLERIFFIVSIFLKSACKYVIAKIGYALKET